MPNSKNQTNLESLKERLAQAKSAAIVDYQGVTVNELTNLRSKLRDVDSEFFVTKNTLINLAFDKNADVTASLSGMNALILSYADEVSGLKIAFDFQKDSEKLTIKNGSLNGQIVDADAIKALSKLPSKNELIISLISRLNGPAYGLVNVLQAGPRNLVYALQAIANK
ncbi:50S ribosomal protein L10 [Microgenomates group bacterium]|nr:50S ribosomal protein L10 [Microgenomates group bacterium]